MHGSVDTNPDGCDTQIVGRRGSARLRLSVPAKLQTTLRTLDCVLVNISRTGARIALEYPLEIGEFAVLKCARLEEYADVVRCGPGHNGLQFDRPLSKEQILALRAHSENAELEERHAFRREVRNWVTGGR